MTKITTTSPISSISGKLNHDDDFYVATKRRTGTVYLVHRSRKQSVPWSKKQIAHRKAFALRCKTVSAWLKANAPQHNGDKGTEAYQRMLAQYKAQHKISNIFAFVSKRYRDGVIDF